jgi:hypothetical protein
LHHLGLRGLQLFVEIRDEGLLADGGGRCGCVGGGRDCLELRAGLVQNLLDVAA